jgi:N-acetylglucosaminyl-diphospho-decaprenol L-rhamnosyltransferase
VASRALDVVIVSHECRELVLAAVRSVREHPPAAGATVTVVDNASSDGTVSALKAAFPGVTVVPFAENRGFSAASNAGIRLGKAPIVLALNPDTRVGPGALDSLLSVLEQHPEAAVVGPKLVREDGSLDHAARRSFPTIAGALGHFTGLGRRPGAPAELAQYLAPEVEAGPVDAVNGACMLMRRDAVEQAGLFDEGYWLYMEDLDLCYRLKQAGWTVWYEPSVAIVHRKGGSSGRFRRPRINTAFHYGMFRFYRRHYAPQRNPLVNAAVYGGIAVKLASSLVRSVVARRILRS